MESARLTAAHALLSETSRSTSTVERHNAVANEFAKTAETTRDGEALRVLKLLETEHRRLAKLVQTRANPRLKKDLSLDESTFEDSRPAKETQSAAQDTANDISNPSTPPKRTSSPTLERRPARPLSSSIANNLATARGIPTVQQRHARTPPSISGRLTTAGLRSDQKSSPTTAASDASAAGTKPVSPTKPPSTFPGSEDSFQRFYSNFEGLWSRLSAPLAFAGLPLIPENANDASITEKPDQEEKTDYPPQQRTTSQESPNLDSIYSRAALQALRAEHGANLNVHESFFLVPQGKHAAPPGASIPEEDEEPEFVDALSSPNSKNTSPSLSRHITRHQPHPHPQSIPHRGPTTNKTFEELETENASLKTLTDKLSQRLYMWEKNAQSQTSALQQSIRNLQPPGHIKPEEGELAERVKALEEELREAKSQGEKQKREIGKLETVVGRYRERWEKLKEGARSRRPGDAVGSPGAAGGGGAGAGETSLI